MTWPLMQVSIVVYISGLVWIQRHKWQLVLYIWSAFGLVFLLIHLIILQGWHLSLARFEALHVQMLLAPFGLNLQILSDTSFLVPDSTGWSGLAIGIECSTLIEVSVFAGLILFYPKLSMQKRWIYLLTGAVGTYLLNILRITLIVLMIVVWGKPVVPLAHTVVGRMVYFVGVVGLYWFLLTKPTLHIVRRRMEASGRAVR